MRVYQVTTEYGCFAIEANDDGVVVTAAPIAKWTVGKKISHVLDYYIRQKLAQVRQVD